MTYIYNYDKNESKAISDSSIADIFSVMEKVNFSNLPKEVKEKIKKEAYEEKIPSFAIYNGKLVVSYQFKGTTLLPHNFSTLKWKNETKYGFVNKEDMAPFQNKCFIPYVGMPCYRGWHNVGCYLE